MVPFEQLFGRPAAAFRNTIVLTPFLSKGLLESFQIQNWVRGNPFSCGSNDHLTLVHTQIGAPFVGDCTLYLEETAAECLLFWGACGAVTSELPLGALATPEEVLNCESFSDLLHQKINTDNPARPDAAFLEQFLNFAPDLKKVRCAAFGSFKLEDQYQEFLKEKDVGVVEMETAAFFHAAEQTGKKAIALLYVTDILKEKHVFAPMSPSQQTVVQLAQSKGVQLIQNFAQQLNVRL